MMRFLLAATLVSSLSTAHALAEDQSFPSDNGVVVFSLATARIGCIYIPWGGTPDYMPADSGPELRCDRLAPDPARFVLHRSGSGEMVKDAPDLSCCSAENVLADGNVWTKSIFTCQAAGEALTCKREDGHAFTVGPEKSVVE